MKKFTVIPRYIKASREYPNNGYLYITKHGVGPGTLPRDVEVLRVKDLPNYYTAIWLDRFLTTRELDEYDIPSETKINTYLGRIGYCQKNGDVVPCNEVEACSVTASADAYKRVYIVNDASTGIPISYQGYGPDGHSYGTLQECIDRLNTEVEECHKCGLDEITDKDFEIKNVETGEIVL